MKKKIILAAAALLLIALILFIRSTIVTYAVLEKPAPEFCPPSPRCLIQKTDRKLIKNGELEFTCRRLDETRPVVEQALIRCDAFISSERLSVTDGHASQYLEIQVPADRFDELMETLSKGAAKINERRIRITDVTEQYVDTETRLSVKRELESRYRQLLNKAETVKDILAIEEQIAILREDIEGAEIQLKQMDNRITYSTMEVTYYEKKTAPSIPFSEFLARGVNNGWNNLAWVLVGLVNIWPFLLILSLLLITIRFRRRTSRS